MSSQSQNSAPKFTLKSTKLLGVIQNTLNKFKTEDEKLGGIKIKRDAVNYKVQEKIQKQNEEIEALELERKFSRERELREIEQMKKEDEERRMREKELKYFKTSEVTHPRIYYLPARLDAHQEEELRSRRMECS